MSKDRDASVQESLYRLETLFARTQEDFKDLQERLTMIEKGQAGGSGSVSAQVEVLLAGLGGRLDQLDERLHRIEHRLGLVLEHFGPGTSNVDR
ncbi:hypothetical protein [Beijerinckia mobilis]|uniref:hypothetical protein n=1 Tax=Beijerinckia mobilis TaxID=231434 RepID=UPI00054D8198|nr:hypothetical protein [Beijerinckia mobilis]